MKESVVIEFDNSKIGVEEQIKIREFAKKELGINIKLEILPSNRTSIKLNNSEYDLIEYFEDTLYIRFNNIEDFIKLFEERL